MATGFLVQETQIPSSSKDVHTTYRQCVKECVFLYLQGYDSQYLPFRTDLPSVLVEGVVSGGDEFVSSEFLAPVASAGCLVFLLLLFFPKTSKWLELGFSNNFETIHEEN